MTDSLKYIGILQRTQGKRSRYRRQRLIEVDGIVSQETWRPVDLPLSSKDKMHMVKDHERLRLDLLADQYYGDQYLWWVIAFANNIVDPFMELNNQDTPVFLRIPDPAVISQRVLR